MSCLDENEIAGLVRSSLPPDKQNAARAHLDACASCRVVVAEVLRLDSGIDGSKAPEAELESEPRKKGDALGRYVLLDLLGVGGMGCVYSAFDPELERKIALKLLSSRARILQEARVAAKLSHPNIVVVHDVGVTEEQPFVAMELLEGGTLRQWKSEQPRHWRDIVSRFVEAGRGLAAAHAQGVIHRDFKPDNVLLGSDGRARVTDFGLAASGVSPTGSGGTPAYMAPEQRASTPFDARVDQFAFCISLYELLFDTRPGETRSTDKRVPASVLRVIERGLQPKPEDRFPSMEALLTALEAALHQRARRLQGAAALVLLFTALSVTVFASRRNAVTCAGAQGELNSVWTAERRATLRHALGEMGAKVESLIDTYAGSWVEMHTEVCRATRVEGHQTEAELELRTACLKDGLRELDALLLALNAPEAHPRAVEAVLALPPVRRCSDAAQLRASRGAPEPADETSQRLQQLLAKARALTTTGQFTPALATAREAVELARAHHRRRSLAQALLLEGRTARNHAQAERAQEAYSEAALVGYGAGYDALAAEAWIDLSHVVGVNLRQLEQAHHLEALAAEAVRRVGNDDELNALFEDRRGSLLADEGKLEPARVAFARALDRTERFAGPNGPQILEPLTHLGTAEAFLSQFEPARVHLERAQKLAESLYGSEHPTVLRIRTSFAQMESNAGNSLAAVAMLESMLGPIGRIFGEGSLRFAGTLTDLAFEQARLERWEDAVATSQRARALYVKAGKDGLRGVGNVSNNLVLASLHLGQTASARQLADELLESRSIPAPYLLALEGEVLFAEGKLDRAIQKLSEARELFAKTSGENHFDTLETSLALAKVLAKKGDLTTAWSLTTQAVDRLRQSVPADHFFLGRAQLALARLQLQRREYAAAAQLLEAVISARTARPHAASDLQTARALLEEAQRRGKVKG